MRTIRLEIDHICTVRALHIYLAYMLELPAHYGKNLDALYDVLCEESEDIQIVLSGMAASEEMAAYLPRLEHVMHDAAQESEHVEFVRI